MGYRHGYDFLITIFFSKQRFIIWDLQLYFFTNKSTRFISKEIQLKVSNNESLFTKKYSNQEIITMPIAHKQGNYFADELLLKKLEDNNQIAFKYTNNPNGSCNDIAGIFNKQKNILGMMPHPERAAESILGSKDGIKIFESILSNM